MQSEIWGICVGMDTKGVGLWWKKCKVGSDQMYCYGLPRRDSTFNVTSQGVRKGSKNSYF